MFGIVDVIINFTKLEEAESHTESAARAAVRMSIGGVLAQLRKHWFLIGVVAVITLAKLQPFLGAKEGGSGVALNRTMSLPPVHACNV